MTPYTTEYGDGTSKHGYVQELEHSFRQSYVLETNKLETTSDKKAHRSSASPAYDNINVYTLFAVVNHQGKMDTGHYTMFAKHRGQVKLSEDVFTLFSFIH